MSLPCNGFLRQEKEEEEKTPMYHGWYKFFLGTNGGLVSTFGNFTTEKDSDSTEI